MRFLVFAFSLLVAVLRPASAEMPAGERELRAAFADWFVIQLVDTRTGGALSEAHRNMDGTNQRNVPVVFVDAGHAAEFVGNLPDADQLEGRLVNAADVYLESKYDVVWRVPAIEGAVIYYISAPNGDPLTAKIKGALKILAFADLADAQTFKRSGEERFSTPEVPIQLDIQPLVISDIANQIVSGSLNDLYVRPSPTIARWAAQRDAGAVLMKDYETEQAEALKTLGRASE